MSLPELLVDNFATTLTGNGGSITSNAVSLKAAVAAPSSIQGPGQFRILVESEQMLVTGGASTTTWTVVRGISGTTATTHTDGVAIIALPTADGLAAWRSPDHVQAGVTAAGDGAVSATTINSSTGAITTTVAAGTAWVKEPVSSSLVRTGIPSGGYTATPGTLPATTKYAVVGIDLIGPTAGQGPSIGLSAKGTDQNTAALALTNTPATAAGRLRLADVVILNTAGSYTTPSTRDRRPWARGAYWSSGSVGAANYSITSTSNINVLDAANLSARIECTGAPLEVTFQATATHATVGANTYVSLLVDGALAPVGGPLVIFQEPVANYTGNMFFKVPYTPAAGSHLFQIAGWVDGGTGVINGAFFNNVPLYFVIEERVRINSNNGTS